MNTQMNKFKDSALNLKAQKQQILECILNLIPARLKPEAERICHSINRNDQIYVNNKHELIINTQLIPHSNILTFIIEGLIKPPKVTREAGTQTANEQKIARFDPLFDRWGRCLDYWGSTGSEEDVYDDEDGESR